MEHVASERQSALVLRPVLAAGDLQHDATKQRYLHPDSIYRTTIPRPRQTLESTESLSLSLSLYPVCTARFLWRAHGCTELSGPEGRRTKHDPSAAMDASYRAPVCVSSSNMAAPRSYHLITICVQTAVTRRWAPARMAFRELFFFLGLAHTTHLLFPIHIRVKSSCPTLCMK